MIYCVNTVSALCQFPQLLIAFQSFSNPLQNSKKPSKIAENPLFIWVFRFLKFGGGDGGRTRVQKAIHDGIYKFSLSTEIPPHTSR